MQVETLSTVLSLMEHMASQGTFSTQEFTHVGTLTAKLQLVVSGQSNKLEESVVRDVVNLLSVTAKRGAFSVDQFILVGTVYEQLNATVKPSAASSRKA